MAKYTVEIKNNKIVNITPITKSMEIAEAKAILEEYMGDHIAVIGKGKTLSENQKKELRRWADVLAPSPSCKCKGGYNEGYDEGYNEGYADGEAHKEAEIAEAYDEGYADGCNECECDCCDEVDEVSAMARRMIARIEEILGE